MEFTRYGVRKWATRAFVTLGGAIILTVVAQFFVQVAADKGWYANAGRTWDRFVTPLFRLATSAPILAFVLLFGGVVIGLWLDAYLVRRSAKHWWHGIQAFSIRDAGCLLAGVKRNEFEKSDRAISIANELRGYVNSGHVPLFLEMAFERIPPDLTDPKAQYEPPFDKKNVGYDAVIAKQFVERMAWGRHWELPWPVPKPDPDDKYGKPFKRPVPIPSFGLRNYLGKLGALGDQTHVGQIRPASESDDSGGTTQG